jgi:hypothetical protein
MTMAAEVRKQFRFQEQGPSRFGSFRVTIASDARFPRASHCNLALSWCFAAREHFGYEKVLPESG